MKVSQVPARHAAGGASQKKDTSMDGIDRSEISVADAARCLCVTVQTIRNLIHAGKVRAKQIGKIWVVDRESVDAEIARRYPRFIAKPEE